MFPILPLSLLACVTPSGDSGLNTTCGAGDCGGLSVTSAPDAPFDECAPACVTVTGGEPATEARLTDAGDVPLTSATFDADGAATLCPPAGTLTPGEEDWTVSSADGALIVSVDVRPFGWSMGRDRAADPLTELSRVPELSHPAQPLLAPRDGSWFAYQVTSPSSLDETWLAFAGTDSPDGGSSDGGSGRGTYQIGIARVEDGAVVRVSSGPIVPSAGAWDAESQNSPALTFDGTTYTLYYQGLSEPDAAPVIGRAFSTDGWTWEADPNNPIHAPEGGKASHPTVIDQGDGLVEMWTIGDEGAAELSLSSDGGASFEQYCGGPTVLAGKAPEIRWDGDRYSAVWGTQEGEISSVGWAESADGIRWVEADEPILLAGSSGWDDGTVSPGSFLMDDSGISLLYVGVAAEPGREPRNGIGVAVGGW